MKISTTIFLAILLAGLSWYYFSTRPPTAILRPAGELSPIEVLKLEEGDSLSWLRIERRGPGGETLALRREEGAADWRLEFPVTYPAESLLVEGMISSLKMSRRMRRLPLRGPFPKGTGLEVPQVKIGIETRKVPRQRFLLLGEAAPVGGAIYARWADEKEYFLMPAEIRAVFQASLYTLRRKKLFRVNWDRVSRIEFKRGRLHFELIGEGGKWSGKTAASTAEISLEKVRELIYSLESLYIKDFLDGKNPANREFHLLPDFAFIAVRDEEGTQEKLVLGAPARNQEAVYAVREKENVVLFVSERKLRSLTQAFREAFQEVEHDSGEYPASPRENQALLPKGAAQPV